ncbi:hypothetical protein [Desulfovibrio sp.]|uniref:hypothetical protein n=1 Tax=Desulfovibrio sp. TaxID=885 RepID=UPI0023D403B7|nr:hypothetical protein [Desulfovibrio sp.]MDE7242167.1 hypothetical protein [Desulfovibrio sp.]
MAGIVRNRPAFFKGVALLGSFLVLFYFLLTPVMPGEDGKRLTGLEYADEVFNELSKGSSYFIPQVRETLVPLMGKEVRLRVTLRKPALARLSQSLLEGAGASVSAEGATLSFTGDLGRILQAAADDADLLYHNDGAAVSEKNDGAPALEVAQAWWYLLKPCIQELQKQQRVADAKAVDQVLARAIEPGNNFYGIEPADMSANVLLVCGLLAFYVLYTLWYGFGIYEIFEGLGLVAQGHKEN